MTNDEWKEKIKSYHNKNESKKMVFQLRHLQVKSLRVRSVVKSEAAEVEWREPWV